MLSLSLLFAGFPLSLLAPLAPLAGGGPECRAAAAAVVHEWGTFTSVVRADGRVIAWNPHAGTEPLPPFVHRDPAIRKLGSAGTVRMETPVIYFHTDRPATFDVRVDFPLGAHTEWYPAATLDGHRLEWLGVEVDRGSSALLPTTLAGSHYFAARGTSAALLTAGGESERFLFYRGVGDFAQPLAVRLDGDRVVLTNRGPEPIEHAMLFERRGDQIAFARMLGVLDSAGPELAFERSRLPWSRELSLGDLKVALRAQGLFEDEAEAMIATWREDWFDEGLRVFYVLPRAAIDRLLPLSILPRPQAIERALIGRLEVLEADFGERVLDYARRIGGVAAGPERDALIREARAATGRFASAILFAAATAEECDPTLRAGAWTWLGMFGNG